MVVYPNESVEICACAFELEWLYLKDVRVQLIDRLLALVADLVFGQIRTDQRKCRNLRERFDIVALQIQKFEG